MLGITARRPRGLMRWLARLPIWLYRFHLGWLLGKRFLLLTHRGRKSGLPRQAVVEVVDHDPKPARTLSPRDGSKKRTGSAISRKLKNISLPASHLTD